MTGFMLVACASDPAPHYTVIVKREIITQDTMDIASLSTGSALTQADYIAAGYTPPDIQRSMAISAAEGKRGCSFSSEHRKNMIGYEFDPNNNIAFKFSPDVDVLDPMDAELDMAIRYTRTLGAAPKKRPCTYGGGFYGWAAYVRYNGDVFNDLTNTETIKSLIREKLAD